MPSQLQTAEAETPGPVPKPAMTAAPTGVLPSVSTSLSPEEILERLTIASKRGRLPGFAARPDRGGLFGASAHGTPFDSVLIADHQPGRLTFRLRILPRMPWIFGAILVLSIWPGVYFMDELVAQLLPSLWRPWVTYYWYLPLTIIPTPWMWRSVIRRSKRSAHEHSVETIGKVAAELGGTVVP